MKQPKTLQEIARIQLFEMIIRKCASIEREAEIVEDDCECIIKLNNIRDNFLGILPTAVLDDICAMSNDIDSKLNDDTYLYQVIMHSNLKSFRFHKTDKCSAALMSSARLHFWNQHLQLCNVVNLDIRDIQFTISTMETVSVYCKQLENLTIPALDRANAYPSLDLGLNHLEKCVNMISLYDFYEFGDIQAMTVFNLVKALKNLERINYRYMGSVLSMFSSAKMQLPMLKDFMQYNPDTKHMNSLTSVCPNVCDVKMRDPDYPEDILTILKNSTLKLTSLELDSCPCAYHIFDLLKTAPCKNLRSLKLLRCTNDFDRGTIRTIAESCPKIEVLHLSSGWILPMEVTRVQVDPKWFNKLQDLLLRGSKCWDPEVLRMCLLYAPEIQMIKLDHIFNQGFEMSTYFLDILTVNPMKELRSLKLWQYRSYLSNETLVWLTTYCCQLTDLELYCIMGDDRESQATLNRIKKIVNIENPVPPQRPV